MIINTEVKEKLKKGCIKNTEWDKYFYGDKIW